MSEYNIIEAENISTLEASVNSYLDRGYEVCGGVSTVDCYGMIRYYQAVVKPK